MSETSNPQTNAETASSEDVAPTLRDRLELVLFLAVEIICILLFADFLFFGFYVK